MSFEPLPINARFVQKLQRMCDDPSSDALIAWSADGTKIHILDLEPFSQQLLPQYFKHNSFSSFIRQMNTYGFNKVDADGWTFAHPHFRRDDPEAMKLIKRRTGGGPAGGGASSAAASQGDDAGGGGDDAIRDELLQMRAHTTGIAQRIGELSEQLLAARQQQASTRESMGKIVTFLSQVYSAGVQANASVAASASADGAAEVDVTSPGGASTAVVKRRRTDGGDGAPPRFVPAPLAELMAPRAHGDSSTSTAAAAAAGLLPGLPGLPTVPLPSRDPSLGAQAIAALPPHLQQAALALVGSPELQDEAISTIAGEGLRLSRQASEKSVGGGGSGSGGGGSGGSGGGSGAPVTDAELEGIDVEGFLWDFLEEAQERFSPTTDGAAEKE